MPLEQRSRLRRLLSRHQTSARAAAPRITGVVAKPGRAPGVLHHEAAIGRSERFGRNSARGGPGFEGVSGHALRSHIVTGLNERGGVQVTAKSRRLTRARPGDTTRGCGTSPSWQDHNRHQPTGRVLRASRLKNSGRKLVSPRAPDDAPHVLREAPEHASPTIRQSKALA